jgi:anti-sigma regulatory factor (Ser/Thr protein kinase)
LRVIGVSAVDVKSSLLRLYSPSEIRTVAGILQKTERFVAGRGWENPNDLLLVLRELLLNAIVHGNKGKSEMMVKTLIEDAGEGRFRIEVEDEGEGFDFLKVPTKLPDDPKELSRRGYLLISALSERISFEDKGRRISVTVNLKESKDSVFEEEKRNK